LNPGAIETCNGIDDNCNSRVDADEVAQELLCPPIPNVASNFCAGASGCAIDSCNDGWVDNNHVYADGCERISTTISSLSHGDTFVVYDPPCSSYSDIIYVENTVAFPASGTVHVETSLGRYTVSYSGKSSVAFTGVSYRYQYDSVCATEDFVPYLSTGGEVFIDPE